MLVEYKFLKIACLQTQLKITLKKTRLQEQLYNRQPKFNRQAHHFTDMFPKDSLLDIFPRKG